MPRQKRRWKPEPTWKRGFSIRRDVVARNRLANSRKGTTVRVDGTLYEKVSGPDEQLKVVRVKKN